MRRLFLGFILCIFGIIAICTAYSKIRNRNDWQQTWLGGLITYVPVEERSLGYALIINGDDSDIHEANCMSAYAALDSNSFQDVIVLTNGKSMKARYKGVEDCTRDNIGRALRYFAKEIKPEDLFTLYVTGHGDVTTDCFINLVPQHTNKIEPLFYSELASLLEPIRANKALMVFDQCHGSKFAARLASSRNTCVALAMSGGVSSCPQFAVEFWKAIGNRMSVREAVSKAAFAQVNGQYAVLFPTRAPDFSLLRIWEKNE